MNFKGFKIPLKSKLLFVIAACYLYSSKEVDDGRSLMVQESGTLDEAQENAKRKMQGLSPVITVFVTPHTNMEELCHSMKSLRNVRGNLRAPVLTFHPEEPSDSTQEFLRDCTDRTVLFSVVDMNDFPEGFEPEPDVDYTHSLINRFWTSGIWDHPDLAPYDIVMRFDHDTCFSTVLGNVPGFSSAYHVYSSQFFPGTYEPNVPRLRGMFEFVEEYKAANHIQPAYPKMWQYVLNTVSAANSIPNFQDTFEISRKSFMQSPAVAAFHRNLTDSPPYGYFSQGWTVDSERFLTAALFTTKVTADIHPLDGFVQKDLQTPRVHPGICHFD